MDEYGMTHDVVHRSHEGDVFESLGPIAQCKPVVLDSHLQMRFFQKRL